MKHLSFFWDLTCSWCDGNFPKLFDFGCRASPAPRSMLQVTQNQAADYNLVTPLIGGSKGHCFWIAWVLRKNAKIRGWLRSILHPGSAPTDALK